MQRGAALMRTEHGRLHRLRELILVSKPTNRYGASNPEHLADGVDGRLRARRITRDGGAKRRCRDQKVDGERVCPALHAAKFFDELPVTALSHLTVWTEQVGLGQSPRVEDHVAHLVSEVDPGAPPLFSTTDEVDEDRRLRGGRRGS